MHTRHYYFLYSMVSVGVHTNGSQFYISLNPTQTLNGRSVVFGRLTNGEEILQRIEKVKQILIYSVLFFFYHGDCGCLDSQVFTAGGAPATEITIADCGVTGL